MLSQNLFTLHQKDEIHKSYGNNPSCSKVSVLDESKYIGIEFPLCYDLRDYGVNIYTSI